MRRLRCHGADGMPRKQWTRCRNGWSRLSRSGLGRATWAGCWGGRPLPTAPQRSPVGADAADGHVEPYGRALYTEVDTVVWLSHARHPSVGSLSGKVRRLSFYTPFDPSSAKTVRLTASQSWNQIFFTISPLLIQESNEHSMRMALENQFLPKVRDYFSQSQPSGDIFADNTCRIDDDCFRTIIVQLRALGLIGKSTRTRSVKDTGSYWTLTPFGDNIMNKLRAISRVGTGEDT